MPGLTNITFHGLNRGPNPTSSQGNSSSRRKKGLVCITEDNIQTEGKRLKTLWAGSNVKVSETLKRQVERNVALTLHCCARWLREERKKQEIDEVDEGQDIVPEQASCRKQQNKSSKSDQL